MNAPSTRAPALIAVAWLWAAVAACGSSPAGPSPPAAPTGPDLALVADAVDYWRSVLGLQVVLLPSDTAPRILIRAGVDGLGTADGRALIDGTDAGNWATSALVVVRPSVSSRRLYRHEVGHALGFLAHSDSGLMAAGGGPDVLSDRERNMMVALYSLPAGSRVEADGTWMTPEGASGQLADAQAARDILDYNMNAPAGSPFRRQNVTCRWREPVAVYVQ